MVIGRRLCSEGEVREYRVAIPPRRCLCTQNPPHTIDMTIVPTMTIMPFRGMRQRHATTGTLGWII